MKIKLLDCTLRDGAHVNGGAFGKKNTIKIIRSLVNAKIDIIEIGFLQDVNYDPDIVFFDSITQAENLLLESSLSAHQSDFSLMVRPDRCSLQNIDKHASIINTIRFAFYLEDFNSIPEYFNHARSLGYKCFLNPVAISTNTLEEVESLLIACKDLEPDGMSIVDTFGALRLADFENLTKLFDSLLEKNSMMGIHLHENLSLSFGMISNYLIKNANSRNIIIDSSLLGMGRIPGNTPTELVVDLINSSYGGSYKIKDIMSVIHECIIEEKLKRDWGYRPEYMISGSLNIHRSYAEYFVEEIGLNLQQATSLMNKVYDEGKGEKFDQPYAKSLIAGI